MADLQSPSLSIDRGQNLPCHGWWKDPLATILLRRSKIMNNIFSDRRKVARYAVHVPISVVEVGNGSTTDISAAGVGFLIDRLLEPGSPIRFELALEENDVMLRCDGVVVRVENRGLTHFTAATIEDIAV